LVPTAADIAIEVKDCRDVFNYVFKDLALFAKITNEKEDMVFLLLLFTTDAELISLSYCL